SAEIYKAQNREDLYAIETEEQKVIEEYLPQQLDREAITSIVEKIIAEVGATSAKDMGKVMGAANQKLAGQADGRTLSEIVKELLNRLYMNIPWIVKAFNDVTALDLYQILRLRIDVFMLEQKCLYPECDN